MQVTQDVRPRVKTDIGYDDPDDARQRDELLAIASHELRNPLGAIDLAAQMLEHAHDDRLSQKQVQIIRRATRRMDRLLQDLMDMSSISAGRFTIEKKPEDVTLLASEILDAHEVLAADNGLTIVRDLRCEGVIVPCDRDRIAQVLSNLVGNSIKFCRPGDAITVRCEHDEWTVQLHVEDTGCGISADDIAHIFQAYWSKSNGKKSTGLGLYICKGIVDAHGGSIDVTSAPGRTTFVVALPLR